jgi:hypothetical protein
MANAFMPSAFASMAGAGQDTLEQIMKQRLFEQQLLQSQVGMQRQVNMDLEQSRRFDAQERYQQGLLADREQDNQVRLRIAQGKLDADTQAAGAEAQARAAVTKAMEAGDYALAQRLAIGAGITPPRQPAMPKVEKTLDEKLAERKALRTADKEVDARFKTPKATKVAKDNPALPTGFRAAIRNRIGSAGFEDRDAAFKSIQASWPKWRANYPSLDASMVKSELDNMYGPRDSQNSVITPGLRARIAAKLASR